VWIERFTSADVPFAPVNSIEEALDDPHLRALGILEPAHNDAGAPRAAIRSPILLDGQRPSAIRPAPLLGEHTDEILREYGRPR